MRQDSLRLTSRSLMRAVWPLILLFLTSSVLAQSPPDTATATPEAASGGGLYINILWLILIIVSVSGWLYEVSWVKADATGIGFHSPQWVTGLMTGGLFFVLLTLFVHPIFSLALIIGSAGAFAWYLSLRNEKVPSRHQIFPNILGGEYEPTAAEETSATDLPHVDVNITNQRGQTLEEYIGARPDFADAAEKLGDLLAHACNNHAQALRLAPGQEAVIVYYKLDGVVQRIDVLPDQKGRQIVSGMASFLGFKGKEKPSVDVSLSLPGHQDLTVTASGEKTSNGAAISFTFPDWHPDIHLDGLEGLGMRDEMIQRVHHAVGSPGNIVLFSGPPSSGRTCTYHAALGQIDIFTTSVTVLETNPVHDLDQVTRHEVDVGSETEVEEILPSIFRQGVDVFGLDEIATPQAIASLLEFVNNDNGRILGTIKGASAAEAIMRFSQPLDSAQVSRALGGVVCQRLVRTLCRNCKEQYDPNPKLLKKLKIKPGHVGTWYRATGCGECLGTGYKGQTALFELLTFNDRLRKLIAQGKVTKSAVKKTAGPENLTTLYQDALSKVKHGTTTLKEIRRVLK